jgi:hypothetical protein
MLEHTDRMRALCRILELNEAQFTQRIADKKGKTPSEVRESTRAWWVHRRQPRRDAAIVFEVLRERAVERNELVPWIQELWGRPMTPAEFATECGVSLYELATVFSERCQKLCFEEIDKLPFLHLMREEWNRLYELTSTTDAISPLPGRTVLPFQTHVDKLQGSYDLYRTHSSERYLCREYFAVSRRINDIAGEALYHQYAEGRRERTIRLSLFFADQWVHAIGAYRDVRPPRDPELSMVHLTIINAPYRSSIFAGVMHDVIDNRAGVAAERVLLVRRKTDEGSHHPTPVSHTDITEDELHYRKFLRHLRDDDVSLLAVDHGRIARILEGELSPEDRLP